MLSTVPSLYSRSGQRRPNLVLLRRTKPLPKRHGRRHKPVCPIICPYTNILCLLTTTTHHQDNKQDPRNVQIRRRKLQHHQPPKASTRRSPQHHIQRDDDGIDDFYDFQQRACKRGYFLLWPRLVIPCALPGRANLEILRASLSPQLALPLSLFFFFKG